MNSEKIEEIAGQVIIAGFEGTGLSQDVRRAARRGALGGIAVFGRNVKSHEQVADMIEELGHLFPQGRFPIAAVDQEGGRVARIRQPLTVLPPARKLGAVDDVDLTRKAGFLVGRELGSLGFTLNLAPVLDVDTNPTSPVIGDRSFGPSPDVVIRHGLAFAQGLKSGGVMPCAKHFPGHGDTASDSHLTLPVVASDRDRLGAIEMAPFAAWARADLGPVMTAHVLFSALDPDLPATVSQSILKGELRDRLRFKGVVLTDDLEMGAVYEMGDPARIAVQAIRAGADGLLVCRTWEVVEAAVEGLISEAKLDPGFFESLRKARARMSGLSRLLRSDVGRQWIGSDQHLATQSEILSRLGM